MSMILIFNDIEKIIDCIKSAMRYVVWALSFPTLDIVPCDGLLPTCTIYWTNINLPPIGSHVIYIKAIALEMLMKVIITWHLELTHLTHWGRVTHICVGNLTIIGSDNGLSPSRRQAIIWTNAGILLIGPLGTNFSEVLIGIQTFAFKKMHLKMSSAKWRPFCLGLNVLKSHPHPQGTTSWQLKAFKCFVRGKPFGTKSNSYYTICKVTTLRSNIFLSIANFIRK